MNPQIRSQQETDALYDWILELRDEGMSYRRIGLTVGLGRDSVKRWLRKGPPRRARTTLRANDPAIVAEMVKMRRQGLSVRVIAKELRVNYQTVYRRTRGHEPKPVAGTRSAMSPEVERLFRRFEDCQTPENYRALREAVRRYEGLSD